jgi:hypothetical protein
MIVLERKAGEGVQIGPCLLRVVEVQPGRVVFALLDAGTDAAPRGEQPGHRRRRRPARPGSIRTLSCRVR